MRKCKSVKELFSYQLSESDLIYYKQTRQIDIHTGIQCSLKCPYCVTLMNKKKRTNILLDKIGVDVYLQKVLAIFGTYHPLRFTIAGPGEPSESPYFVQICKTLLEKDYNLRIFTNLGGIKNLLTIAPFIKRERQVIITSSYHFGAFLELGEYGQKRNNLFLSRFESLCRAKFWIQTMNTPLTPMMLNAENTAEYLRNIAQLQQINKKYQDSVFIPTPVELYGTYHDKPYPKSYTEIERQMVKQIHQTLHYHMECHGSENKVSTEKVSDKTDQRLQYAFNYPQLQGMPCLVGFRHVAIDLQGWMYYCNSTPRSFLGNLETYDSKQKPFLATDGICHAKMCNCKSAGCGQSLFPHKVLLNEYYYAWYMEQNQPEIAELFVDDLLGGYIYRNEGI